MLPRLRRAPGGSGRAPVAAGARSPFGAGALATRLALGYGAASAVWIVAGDGLPGGRWLAVHLFTLGVVTNVILVFSGHFAETVTRTGVGRPAWQTPAANVGIVLVLVGVPTGASWAVAAGATVVTGVVVGAYLRLRRMRRASVGARFAWIARVYERAHGAFVHGAILGLLMGTGVLGGEWYGAARNAHLHVNVLGWAGLTVLATVVFFGPTVVRTRIEAGADARASRALRRGVTGLTVAVFLLLATGVGGPVAVVLRVGAASGLAVYAGAVTVVCAPVIRVARAARPSAPRPALIGACAWFLLVAWADVGIVVTGQARWLVAAGIAALGGVLAQIMLAALIYLTPMLRGTDFAARDAVRRRLEIGATSRAVALNLGVGLATIAVVIGPQAGIAGGWTIRAGWSLVLVALATSALLGVAPIGAGSRGRLSKVARWHRTDPTDGDARV